MTRCTRKPYLDEGPNCVLCAAIKELLVSPLPLANSSLVFNFSNLSIIREQFSEFIVLYCSVVMFAALSLGFTKSSQFPESAERNWVIQCQWPLWPRCCQGGQRPTLISFTPILTGQNIPQCRATPNHSKDGIVKIKFVKNFK